MPQDFSPGEAAYTLPDDRRDAATIIPEKFRPLLGTPPLLRGESGAAYWHLFEQFAIERDPLTLTDWLYLQECVDRHWEIRRLQRVKLQLIEAEKPAAADNLLGGAERRYATEDQIKRGAAFVAQGMLRGDDADRETVEQTLSSMGLTADALTAEAMVSRLDDIERIERMMLSSRRLLRQAEGDAERHRFATKQIEARAKMDVTELDPGEVIT